jgi:hypothetical protein
MALGTSIKDRGEAIGYSPATPAKNYDLVKSPSPNTRQVATGSPGPGARQAIYRTKNLQTQRAIQTKKTKFTHRVICINQLHECKTIAATQVFQIAVTPKRFDWIMRSQIWIPNEGLAVQVESVLDILE